MMEVEARRPHEDTARTANFRTAILRQIQERDKQQKHPFPALINHCNTLSAANTKLRREVWELKQTLQEFSREKEKHKDDRIVILEQKMQAREEEYMALEQKLKDRERELNDSYRQNAEQAKSLFEVMQQKNAAMKEIELKDESYRELSNTHDNVFNELENAKQVAELLTAEVEQLKLQRDNFEARSIAKDLEMSQMKKELATMKEMEERFREQMQKNADQVNKLNMEQERLLEMLNKVKDTNFRKRSDSSQNTPTKEKDEFVKFQQNVSGFFSSIVGKLKGEEGEEIAPEAEEEQRDESFGFSMMSDGDVVPKRFIRKIDAGGEINHIQHSSQGSMFATSGVDNNITIWDALSLSRLKTLHGARRAVTCADFTHNNAHILGASADNNIYVWNYSQDRVVTHLVGHKGSVASAQFTFDSRQIISGSSDRCVKIWDVEKGICVRTIMCASKVMDIANLGRGLLASGHYDKSVRTYDMRTGALVESVQPHEGGLTSVCLSPDGSSILTNSRDSTLKLLDIRANLKVAKSFSSEKYRNTCDWNKACFSGGGKYVIAGSSSGAINVWEVASGKLESAESDDNHHTTVACCCWSLSTSQLLVAYRGENTDLAIWG